MSVFEYLRGHLLAFACGLLLEAFLGLMLPALGVEKDATLLVLLVCGMLLVGSGLWNYLRERRFMRSLKGLAGLDEGALDAVADLEQPEYLEGDLTVEALGAVERSARSAIHESARRAQDYQSYVDTWVHEIKTPLAAMNLFLENHDDPKLQPLRRDIARVENYVEQALYYARSFSVEKDYLVRACPLDELVRAAVRSRASMLIEAHMGIGIDGLRLAGGGSEEAPLVYCDPKWMEFILGQLIDNAVRYRAEDGRSPRIEFAAHVEEAGSSHERVLLSVRDNGCGISEADLPRVFERGFTGDNGRNHERSTGMGLYLVQTLCRKMGLTVSITSELGSWTCVTITFSRLTE